MEVVGQPDNPADTHGARFPATGPLVSRDEVPDGPYRAACVALDYILVGYEVMDPQTTTFGNLDEELAALTRTKA